MVQRYSSPRKLDSGLISSNSTINGAQVRRIVRTTGRPTSTAAVSLADLHSPYIALGD